MQDTNNASASFREIDEHGNPLPHEPLASEPVAGEAQAKIRINPFIVALWVLNVTLMIFAGWAYSESFSPSPYTTFGAEPVQQGIPLQFILMNSMPQILLLSSLTTIALLFWHAWQWQKRRSA